MRKKSGNEKDYVLTQNSEKKHNIDEIGMVGRKMAPQGFPMSQSLKSVDLLPYMAKWTSVSVSELRI